MADTTNFGWTKPVVGGSDGVWGTLLNTLFDDVDTDVNDVKTTADAALPKAGGILTGKIEVHSEEYVTHDLGNMTGVLDIDLADGNFFYGTLTGNVTVLSFSNPPTSGKFGGFILELTNGGAFTIDWTDIPVSWPGGTAPSLTAAGVDFLHFFTRDGGVTWHGGLVREDSS